MDFELTADQREFQAAVRKFLQVNSSRAQVRHVVDDGQPHDPRTWQAMASELGIHGIAIAEEHGGSGAGLLELALVLEEAGRAILCAPLFATVVLAATALRSSDDAGAQAEWLPKIASGELVGTLAMCEDGDAYDLDATQTVATRTPDGWALDGRKNYVLDGAIADLVLVPAQTERGLSLFAVSAPAPGLDRVPLPVLDPTRPMSELRFSSVEATLIGQDGGAGEPLRQTLELATITLAAEQVGGIQACLNMAVEYAGSRVQFGRPIGSFQAIKHKCADMFVDLETSRCAVYLAAWSVANGLGEDALLAEMTGAYVCEAFVRAAAENLQIHGGIGYTWEHDAQLLFKRATSSSRLLRMPHLRREAIARQIGL